MVEEGDVPVEEEAEEGKVKRKTRKRGEAAEGEDGWLVSRRSYSSSIWARSSSQVMDTRVSMPSAASSCLIAATGPLIIPSTLSLSSANIAASSWETGHTHSYIKKQKKPEKEMERGTARTRVWPPTYFRWPSEERGTILPP